MSNELAMTEQDTAVLEQLVVNGDMKALTPEQRVQYYRMRCDSAGLDWRTQPFSYITLQGKLTLYATKTATEQLCEKRKLSCEIVKDGMIGDLYKVQARATGEDGRHTDNIGVVTAGNLKGDALANAMMKAVTKSFRRAVLSHCGLGMLDETETETIPNAVPVPVESAHQPAAQTIELATPSRVNKVNILLSQAVELGFKNKDGNIPNPFSVDMPKSKVERAATVLEKFITDNKPETSTEEEFNNIGGDPDDVPEDAQEAELAA